MCTLCSATRPTEPNAWADMHVASASGGAFGFDSGISRAAYTLDQIANQLTNGYWAWNGDVPRSFDVAPGGTLTYDITALGTAERYLAVSALQAWTDVTGIRFVAASPPPVITQRNEVGDAAASTATTNAMLVNQNFNGTVSASGDEDWVRVTLVAGTTYTISLTGVTLSDPYLSIRNSAGTEVAFNDDGGPGLDSLLSFTPATSGTYYLSARGYGTTTGTYDLTLTTASGADLTFDNTQAGAYSTSELSGNTITSSYVNITSSWDSDGALLNTYFFQTYIHEIGHALGLGHAGNYNGTATWGVDNLYDNDSWQATVMSYFAQGPNAFFDESPFINASYAYVNTLMPADIIAIQNLYGTNVSTRATNTVYGVGGTVTGYLADIWRDVLGQAPLAGHTFGANNATLTIYDTGGIDTINLSTVTVSQTINLAPTAASNVNGLIGNVVIARGTVIENVISGSGHDRINGNTVGNSIQGGAGNDTIYGGAGNDVLRNEAGNDIFVGDAGTDTAVFVGATAVRVDMNTTAAQVTGYGTDRFITIENVITGTGADRVLGNIGHNVLVSGAGNDSMYGGSGNDIISNDLGNDVLSGGNNTDTLLITGATAARINLAIGTAQVTGYGTDIITGFENILSGAGNDLLTGNGIANSITGGAGNDTLYGGAGDDRLLGGVGNDRMHGGTGADDFYFSGGADMVLDFANNSDELYLSRSLWGGGTRTVAQVLTLAQVVGGVHIVFNFGAGNTLTLANYTSIASLSDDILFV